MFVVLILFFLPSILSFLDSITVTSSSHVELLASSTVQSSEAGSSHGGQSEHLHHGGQGGAAPQPGQHSQSQAPCEVTSQSGQGVGGPGPSRAGKYKLKNIKNQNIYNCRLFENKNDSK